MGSLGECRPVWTRPDNLRTRRSRRTVTVLAAIAAAAAVAAGRPVRAADWPTLQRDAARSGYTRDEPRPPYKQLWAFQLTNDTFHSSVQPVVADGKLFVGTMGGRFYALDSETGKELWTYVADGPIFATATVDAGRVFVGTHRGTLYALDVQTGKPAWSYHTGGGIWVCPLAMEGLVMFGTRGGDFVALREADGSVAWKLPVKAPVLQSAAGTDGVVFFGAEDMRLRAVDTKTGQLKWTTPQFEGRSYRFTWPVLAGEKLYTPITGVDDFWLALRRDGNGLGKWEHKTKHPTNDPAYQAKAVEYLTANPDRQAMYVMDSTTGKRVGVLPFFLINGGGAPHPSPIVLADGAVLAAYGGLYFGETDPAFIGRIVFTDGRAGVDEMISTRFVGTGGGGERGFLRMFPADIPFAMSCGGRMLFGRSGTVGAYDLEEEKHYNFPGPRTNRVRPTRASNPPAAPLGGRGSNCASPFAISGRRVYGVQSQTVSCAGGAE